MKTLVLFALLCVSLAAMPVAAQTGTWTAVGSTGVMDESAVGIFQFGTTNLTYNGASLNPIIARYNVTNTFGGGLSDTPPWATLEMGYLDTNPQVSLTATLYRVNPCTGAQTPLCTVTSTDFTAGATCIKCNFTAGINFATNLYYVQVTLARTNAAVPAPQLYTLRLY